MTFRRPRNDEGTSLILALVFLSLFGLLSAALLTLTDSNLKATSGFRNVRSVSYSADGAVEAAIADVREDLTLGVDGIPCPTFSLPSTNGVGNITVECDPSAGSGSGFNNHPLHAVLALADTSTPTEGIDFQGNNEFDIGGQVFSNSALLLGQSQNDVDVFGLVTARGDGQCTNTGAGNTALIRSVDDAGNDIVGGKLCGIGSAGLRNGDDPGYDPPASLPPSVDQLPTCSAVGGLKIATFLEGQYTKSPLQLVVDAGAPCSGRDVYVFAPGVHYFLNVVWNIGAPLSTGGPVIYDVVGGTPTAWPASGPPHDGTACDPAAAGVEFVLDGSTQINLTNQDVLFELCAEPNPAGQQIAMYGIKTGEPGYAGPSSCITAQPYVSGSSCALFKSANKPDVHIHGTIYAPSAALDLTLHNNSRTSIDRGLIARHFRFDVSASAKQGTAPISMPGGTFARGDRDVTFIAHDGPVSGPEKLRARVHFDDGGGATPGGVTAVNHWGVIR